jgi:hypothetical protein
VNRLTRYLNACSDLNFILICYSHFELLFMAGSQSFRYRLHRGVETPREVFARSRWKEADVPRIVYSAKSTPLISSMFWGSPCLMTSCIAKSVESLLDEL